MFTPVSSQAQAFVPAHTAYPHLRNSGAASSRGRPIYPQNPIIYGAHGQPLGPMPQQEHYSPQQQMQQPHQGYPGPSPSTSYHGSGLEDRAPPDQMSRRRPHDEPHAANLPPPMPGSSSSHQLGRRGSSGTSAEYQYPDPTPLALQPVSPASSVASYQSAYSSVQPAAQHQPYYPTQPARRSSPQSTYSYDNRASASPHAGSQGSGSGHPYTGSSLHPPQALPARDGRTPPPAQGQQTASGGSRPGMSIRDMLGEAPGSGGGRSATDSDMLNALNRRPM